MLHLSNNFFLINLINASKISSLAWFSLVVTILLANEGEGRTERFDTFREASGTSTIVKKNESNEGDQRNHRRRPSCLVPPRLLYPWFLSSQSIRVENDVSYDFSLCSEIRQ